MPEKETGRRRGDSFMPFALGVLTALLVGVPFTIFGLHFLRDNVTMLAVVAAICLVLCGLVFAFVYVFRERIFNWFGDRMGRGVVDVHQAVSDAVGDVVNGEYKAAARKVDVAAGRFLTAFAWFRARQFLLMATVGTCGAFAALIADTLLFRQNELVGKQNGLIELQNNTLLGQTRLLDMQTQFAIRQTSLLDAQNVLIEEQNKALQDQLKQFEEQDYRARKAQLVATLYDTEESGPFGFPGPKASVRARAEAAKALVEIERGRDDSADLSNADLSGANLSGANLSGANLSGAKLSGAKLSRADLSGAKLSGADLFRANMEAANLSGTDLDRADLRDAILFEANLSDSTLAEADLSGAILVQAALEGAKLHRADLSRANLSGAILRHAILSTATLSEVDLDAADLSDATLVEANLSGANLKSASLIRADLSRANLRGANLSPLTRYRESIWAGANITGIKDPPEGLAGHALSQGAIAGATDEE